MADRRMYGRDLVDAIMDRDEKKVKKLIRKGANTDFVTKGDKAIHLAARYGLYRTLRYMIEDGEDVNKLNEHGNTALHYAAREGREDIVRLLIDNGANINIQNYEGETPLHGCVGYQPMDVIERFIQMGMDVNTQTETGDTPLHRAVEYSREETVEALLLCKADPYIKNKSGKRPDQLAKVPSIGEQIRTHGLFSAAMSSGYIHSQGMKLTHRDVKRPLSIDRVGMVVEEMDLPSDFPTTFYCRREKSENATMKLNKAGDEEIVSDVYILRVRDVYRDVDVKLTLELYAKPTEKEDLHLKFPLGNGGKLCGDVFERDEKPHCTVTFALVPEMTSALFLCVSPKAEVVAVGAGESKIESEVDPGFSMEIPEGAFKENTALSLKVFEAADEDTQDTDEDSDEEDLKEATSNNQTIQNTPEENESRRNKTVENGIHRETEHETSETTETIDNDNDVRSQDLQLGASVDAVKTNDAMKKEKKEKKKKKKEKRQRKRKKEQSILLSDVYEINLTGDQPTKGLKMQIPLKHRVSANQELQIVRIDDDGEQTVQALPTDVEVTEDGHAVFETSHFSTYVIIPKETVRYRTSQSDETIQYTPTSLDTVKEHVINAKEKRQYARFFVMLRQLDTEDIHGPHVLLVECIRAGASGRRRNRWGKQGYEKQKPKNSKKFKLAPGQEFYIELKGEAIFDYNTGETGTRKLVFSPHRASYQPFNIRLPPCYRTGKGSVLIYPIKPDSKSQDKENDDHNKEEDEENREPISKLNIQLHLPPEEEPFSEEIETIANYKTFFEIREEEEKRQRVVTEKKQKHQLKREKTLEIIQTELKEKGIPSRPETKKEASRFKKPGRLDLNIHIDDTLEPSSQPDEHVHSSETATNREVSANSGDVF